jgi:predicted nucleic acid-binding protein
VGREDRRRIAQTLRIRDSSNYDRLRSALAAFHDEPLTTFHYEEAARLYNLCRSRGVECEAIDILICTIAAQMHWSILTNDRGLMKCIEALRSEGFRL